MQKIVVLLALLGIMTWNLPDSLSLLANDHDFFNSSAPCFKCHGDILFQIEDYGDTNTLHRSLDNQSGCKSCHMNAPIMRGQNKSEDFHAASFPMCLDCHGDNISGGTIYGNLEVHKRTVNKANNSTWLGGINEACVMCHTTGVSIITMPNITVFAFEEDSIDVNGSIEIYDGTYDVMLSAGSTNGKHNFNDDVSCVTCHQKIQDILNQNTRPYDKHNEFGCEGCHRGSGNEVGQTNETSSLYHSAKTKYCSDCHGSVSFPRDCNRCHESHGGFKPGVE